MTSGSRMAPAGSIPAAPIGRPQFSFGDMPATEMLRPAGHSKIDLAIRWSARQSDGLYLQSRYGVLRLSPVGSAIIRITFVKDRQMMPEANPAIAVSHIDRTWMYRERNGNLRPTNSVYKSTK